MKKQTTLTGAAGAHYAMFRLLRLGYVAGFAPEGAPNVDIVLTDLETNNALSIQVKTRNPIGRDSGWHMQVKHEKIISENLFYFFIDLPKETVDAKSYDKPPIIYILPSKKVSNALMTSHHIWLKTPGQNGRPHKDNEMRRLLPDYSKALKVNNSFVQQHSSGWLDEYQENWELLEKKLGKKS